MQTEILTPSFLSQIIQPRDRFTHKGDFGHVLVVGGAAGFSGAPLIAALGAARAGAGLVSIATHPQHASYLHLQQPELMCHGIEQASLLNPLLSKATVCVLGCGLGQNEWSTSLYQAVLDSNLPIVLDADGLNIFAQKHTSLAKSNIILTPHPGEAARLLATTTDKIQADRIGAIQALYNKFGHIIVLKGAGTLIFNGKKLYICEAGNPGMASGGMGDLLAGIIAGLIAQQFDLFTAAKAGVLIHAIAGDLAAEEFGERGLLATDLLPIIQQLVN